MDPKIKSQGCWSPKRPLAENFFKNVNAYHRSKFQLPSWISFRDIDGVPKSKVGAADLLRRSPADKFYMEPYLS